MGRRLNQAIARAEVQGHGGYDDDIDLQTDQLVWRSMNQQAKTIASSRECAEELTNLPRKKREEECKVPHVSQHYVSNITT